MLELAASCLLSSRRVRAVSSRGGWRSLVSCANRGGEAWDVGLWRRAGGGAGLLVLSLDIGSSQFAEWIGGLLWPQASTSGGSGSHRWVQASLWLRSLTVWPVMEDPVADPCFRPECRSAVIPNITVIHVGWESCKALDQDAEIRDSLGAPELLFKVTRPPGSAALTLT